MSTDPKAFALSCREAGAPRPVLVGVKVDGRLDGTLFELTLRQSFRNTGDRVLEVIYTFPLPAQAVLLGFAAELNGQRRQGVVVARQQAEKTYEGALAEGDAPAMLEALGGGLHTANIGNLEPADEIVLETRFALVLSFEQGRLRLAIPTTIAPRYGSAERGGLQPQQVPQGSVLAEYPLALSVTVAGALGSAAVECPTHRFTRHAVDGGVRLDLQPGAWMDRDVVIQVTPEEQRPSLVLRGADHACPTAPVVVMAALQPPLAVPRERVSLELLVDCSGSMAGASITSARAALRGVLAGLGERDRVSLTRFGTHVEHVQAPVECSTRTLRHLMPAVDSLQADLGGTELEQALRAVFDLHSSGGEPGADVLLVTDGQVWQVEETVAAARAGGHRVFAIGVGTSPAEGLLRSLAHGTGGACEFATPGEALEAAAYRMLGRIRQQPWRGMRVDWGVEPLWHCAPPVPVFGGDTVIAFAGFAADRPPSSVRLLATGDAGSEVVLASGGAAEHSPGDGLSRIAAACRMPQADARGGLALAVDYQLMSRHTHCVLVHERQAADKVALGASLHRVESMSSLGSPLRTGTDPMPMLGGRASPGHGSLHDPFSADIGTMAMHSVWRLRRGPTAAALPLHAGADTTDLAIPAFLRRQAAELEPMSFQTVIRNVARHLRGGASVQSLEPLCTSWTLAPELCRSVEQMLTLGATHGRAWLLLAHWLNLSACDAEDPTIGAILRPHLDLLDAELLERCMRHLDAALAHLVAASRQRRRAERLRQALRSITS